MYKNLILNQFNSKLTSSKNSHEMKWTSYIELSRVNIFDDHDGPRTPPRPPNRSGSSSQQPPTAPARQKTRRKSESVPFIISPARVARPARHSLGDLYTGQHWVTSPVWSINGGRHSPPLSNTRFVSWVQKDLWHQRGGVLMVPDWLQPLRRSTW